MEGGMIAVRYAKALFELAEEKSVLGTVCEEMQTIATILKTEPALHEFLENPVVKAQQKKQLLQAALKENVQPMVSSLLHLLITKGRESYLLAICIAFQQFYKEKEGYKEVVLTTATPASEEVKTLIHQKIAEKLQTKINIKTVVEEELIGGFKLQINDMLMDKSIATQLENIKKQLRSK